MTLMTDLSALEPQARQSMDTVLKTLSGVNKHGKKSVSLRPAVFGSYIRHALMGDTPPRMGCTAVMDVLFDMGAASYFVTSDWERIQYPKVMELTGDPAMRELAKSTGAGFMSRGTNILRLEGFYMVEGLSDCVVRCYRSLQRLGSYKVLAEMPQDELAQIVFNGNTLTMTETLERMVHRKLNPTKTALRLVPKMAMTAA